MTETKTRVRWTEEERKALAVEMLRLLQTQPRQSKLQALIQAQQALPEPRRRTVAAWTMVRDQIEPHMKAAEDELARRQAAEQQPAGQGGAQAADAQTIDAQMVDAQAADGQSSAAAPHRAASLSDSRSAPAGDPDDPAAAGRGPTGDEGGGPAARAPGHGLIDQAARHLEALARLGTQALESAVLQVLSSPAVAERLAALIGGALASAASAATPTAGAAAAPAEPPARTVAMPRPKVLVAGLTPAQANELAEEFSESLDLRNWRPGETKDQLRSLGRVCSVAVLVTEALDHDAETMLKSMHLRIVKHAGGLARLKERLHELVDSGMFNVLT